tara:strand:+ start:367 stop:552 length:186 start_codon:yes stop_codon:yes gene_type:complete
MITRRIVEIPYYKKIKGNGPNEVSFFGSYPSDDYEVKFRKVLELNENGRITYQKAPNNKSF